MPIHTYNILLYSYNISSDEATCIRVRYYACMYIYIMCIMLNRLYYIGISAVGIYIIYTFLSVIVRSRAGLYRYLLYTCILYYCMMNIP